MTVTVLDRTAWTRRRAAHEARIDQLVGAHLDRRRRGEAHPVADFLFTYYAFRPAQLRRWHPGAGVWLTGTDPGEWGRDYHAVRRGADEPDAVTVDTAGLLARRRETVEWIRRVLAGTARRPGHFGCFGLHEWAMVYRQPADQVRHDRWRLRMAPERIAEFVDSQRIRCSHFDAYRFFTPAARPLNLLSPTRQTQPDQEQPGCLHANMDLYKWSYRLSPLVPGELVADCFELARDIRDLDMRASPYDLRELGYPPVRIETAEGRAGYVAAQRAFADRAAVLRGRLLTAVAALIDKTVTDQTVTDQTVTDRPERTGRARTDRAELTGTER
ncbi:3-methyladenine DNA glycosylase [Solwaraspora sp. WMMD406]|uniref:3-methyladenine DNA glycosylase n=1 Tax=Solwaraspora sp. WMMD406 TaxID=3016095 RepID=UPI002417B37C|nr:3-methyladenine DNA glycosylase [Solwaraspora sp. WMMD406]MDG4767271.1 3-methyladenine DNA glycosylase [Solwaraspora sp. WMMD406]